MYDTLESRTRVFRRGAVESRRTKDSHGIAGKNRVLATALLLAVSAGHAFAQNKTDSDFRFENVADSTQGFAGFATFPAINDHGAVAFEAATVTSETGIFRRNIFRPDKDGLSTIAISSPGGLSLFGIDPAINAEGTVAYTAVLPSKAHAIFTSDGVTTKTIVNSLDQGLIGAFLGSPSINRSGTVAFLGTRNGFTSQAIFTGNGGPLTPVLDTVNSNFTGFQNVAINASEQIAFVGDNTDGSVGMFVLSTGKDQGSSDPLVDIVDTNNPDFGGFGDPVINKSGTVANDVFRNDGNAEILSGDRRGVAARTDVAGARFVGFDHPSINDSDAVAFFAFTTDGRSGVFMELTGGASPVPVIQTGDTLFGSTVTSAHVGRFALNNRFQVVFQYTLDDGRSGVGIASLKRGDGQGEDEDQE
jgi:hypothetical protein